MAGHEYKNWLMSLTAVMFFVGECQCGSIDSQLSKLPENCEDKYRQMSSLRQNNTALYTELATLRENVVVLSTEIADLNENKKNFTQDFSALRRDITALLLVLKHNSNLSTELTAFRQINISLSTEVADLRQIITEVLAQISALKLTADFTALFSELLVLRKDNTNLSTELLDLKQDYKALSTEMSALRKNNKALSNELSALRKNNTYQYTELSAVTHNLTVFYTKVTDLTQNNTALSTELSALRQKNTLQSTKLSAVTHNITDMSTKFTDLTQNNTALSTELSDLRQQYTNLLLEFQNLSSQIALIRDYLTSVQTSPSTTTSTTTRITTSASDSECSRGMSHSCSHAKFLLWGQIPALCDTETDGGGWVIIQRRTKGDVDFYRDWASYKTGFGTPDTDFWLGNDVIHNLTLRGFRELRVDMIFNKKQLYAQYDVFAVDKEKQNYRLTVSGYRGTAGDSLAYHNNMMFSTYDRDNDADSRNCATTWHGAWWYTGCYGSNLNGVWGVNNSSGIIWGQISGTTSLTFTEIKVRLREI